MGNIHCRIKSRKRKSDEDMDWLSEQFLNNEEKYESLSSVDSTSRPKNILPDIALQMVQPNSCQDSTSKSELLALEYIEEENRINSLRSKYKESNEVLDNLSEHVETESIEDELNKLPTTTVVEVDSHLCGNNPIENYILPQECDSKMYDGESIRGELCVSLYYDPFKNRMKLFIVRAKNLACETSEKKGQRKAVCCIDCYLKVTLLQNKKLRKTWRTTTKRAVDETLYYEYFTFVIDREYCNKLRVQITAMHHNRHIHFSDHVVGKTVIGGDLQLPADEFTHWTEVINSPRKLVTKWHALK